MREDEDNKRHSRKFRCDLWWEQQELTVKGQWRAWPGSAPPPTPTPYGGHCELCKKPKKDFLGTSQNQICISKTLVQLYCGSWFKWVREMVAMIQSSDAAMIIDADNEFQKILEG